MSNSVKWFVFNFIILISAKGSKLACQKSDLFNIVLHCLFVLPDALPLEKRFDVLVLTLTFIINLVEHSEENRSGSCSKYDDKCQHSQHMSLRKASVKSS